MSEGPRRRLARRRWLGLGVLLLLGAVVAELVLQAQAARVAPLLHSPAPGRLAPSPERPLMVPFDVSAQPAVPRVLYVGASTEAGYPFGPRAAPAAWVERILHARGVSCEVLPVAMPGLTAAETADVFGQLFELRPAAIVLGLGHNEYLRSGALLEPHWWNRLQLGRRLSAALGHPPRSERRPTLENDFDHAAVTAAFRGHLAAMQARADAAGVPLLVTVPVCNLADFPPLLGDDSRLAESPDEAWRRGRALLDAGDLEGARRALCLARDTDRWPFRTRGPLIDAIRAEARIVVPVDEALDAAAARGVPGFDLFVDNCHLTMDGLRVLSLAVADALLDAGVLAPPDGGDGVHAAPTTAELLAQSGLTGEEIAAARAVLARGFVGFAVMTARHGELAVMAQQLVDDALAARAAPGELQTSAALLALLAGDVAAARAHLAAAVAAEPATLGTLERLCRAFPWMEDVFARNGLRLHAGRLEELAPPAPDP